MLIHSDGIAGKICFFIKINQKKGSDCMNFFKSCLDVVVSDIKKDPMHNLWVPMTASIVTNTILYLWIWW